MHNINEIGTQPNNKLRNIKSPTQNNTEEQINKNILEVIKNQNDKRKVGKTETYLESLENIERDEGTDNARQ